MREVPAGFLASSDDGTRIHRAPAQTPRSFDRLISGDNATDERRKHAMPAHRTDDYRETPVTTPTSTMAVISFIFGLGAVITFGVTGLPAVLIGHFAWAETSTGDRGGHGLTVAGLFFGYLTVILWIAFIVFIATVGKDIRMPQFPTIPTVTSTTN